MQPSKHDRVNRFLDDIRDLSHENFEILSAIRVLFLEASDDLTEGIKYGGLVFERENRLIGGIFVYKNHLSIEFSEGATFQDAYKVLEGNGKYRRHIKCRTLSDVEEKHCTAYIVQAVA